MSVKKILFDLAGTALVLFVVSTASTVVLLSFSSWDNWYDPSFLSGLQPTVLPQDRPADFSIEVYDGGGMMNISTSYTIDNGHGLYIDNYEGSEVSAEFDLTMAEQDQLWQAVHDAKFDRITTTHEEVYDRGGTSIHLSYDDEYVNVADSGDSFVSGSGIERFFAVQNAVIDVAQPYIDAQKKTVTFKADEVFLPKLQYWQINNTVLFSKGSVDIEQPTTLPLPTYVPLLPGEYSVSVTALPSDATLPVYTQSSLTISQPVEVTLLGPAENPTFALKPIVIHP